MNVYAVLKFLDHDTRGAGIVLNLVFATDLERGFVHPADIGIVIGLYKRRIVSPDKHVAPANVYFIFEADGDRHGRKRFFE